MITRTSIAWTGKNDIRYWIQIDHKETGRYEVKASHGISKEHMAELIKNGATAKMLDLLFAKY